MLMSSWWIGESSDDSEASLLKLFSRRWALRLSGYGDPQLAVTYWSSSGSFGGVLNSSKALPGRVGAGSGGRTGELSESQSAVEVVERAGDWGDSALDGSVVPSRAERRDGDGC